MSCWTSNWERPKNELQQSKRFYYGILASAKTTPDYSLQNCVMFKTACSASRTYFFKHWGVCSAPSSRIRPPSRDNIFSSPRPTRKNGRVTTSQSQRFLETHQYEESKLVHSQPRPSHRVSLAVKETWIWVILLTAQSCQLQRVITSSILGVEPAVKLSPALSASSMECYQQMRSLGGIIFPQDTQNAVL